MLCQGDNVGQNFPRFNFSKWHNFLPFDVTLEQAEGIRAKASTVTEVGASIGPTTCSGSTFALFLDSHQIFCR